MGLQNMQNKDMGLVLSPDAKPRLKWTPELHQRFLEAVSQLGGADKATPKSLMTVMGIPGLTLYHLKSHLQKYRLGKNQQSESCSDIRQEDSTEVDFQESDIKGGYTQINDNLQLAEALKMQMEVQKKLYEQIEVQKHLQMRIETQGKYLQLVLNKAQETLSRYNSSPMGLEAAKAELSELVSMVDTQCLNSSFSGLTETEGLSSILAKRLVRGMAYTTDSSLTFTELFEGKDVNLQKIERGDTHECNSSVLPGMGIDLNERKLCLCKASSSNRNGGTKRSASTISDETSIEKPSSKRITPFQDKTVNQLIKLGSLEKLDLNRRYRSEMNLGWQELDLNCTGPTALEESLKNF